MNSVNISEKLDKITAYWKPVIVGELNGQHVKLVKCKGEFVFHKHENEDELFFVLEGEFDIEYRDRKEKVGIGDFIIIPRGIEHKPVARTETHLMVFEPAGTLNTGNKTNEFTVPDPQRI